MGKEFTKNLITRICKQPRTFEYISRCMKGLDPIKISETLAILEKEGTIILDGEYWIKKDTKKILTLDVLEPDKQSYLKKYMGHFDFLKIPHPLDFEWRNTTKSLNYLIELIGEISLFEEAVLIMGMPTLFASVCLKNLPQKVTLVERNKPIIKALTKLINHKTNIIQADIFSVKPKAIGKYDCVVMDPPWYSEHFYQFAWVAAQSLKVGGTLVISIPPMNTRPDIDKERIDWFSFCQQQGLCIESLIPEKLEYAMPFFEFNAFRSGGIENILPFWRKGDLVFFRKVADTKSIRPDLIEQISTWHEIEIDNSRIRVSFDQNSKENGDVRIENIIKGDILPSVSTRDERRKNANVWTSGNRIFKVSNPKQFYSILEEIKNKNKISNKLKDLKNFIDLITGLEAKEYNNYLSWLYYEMERNSV